ncbi:hypothetical protein FRB99_004343, partial [Tulasnella sp. 403]
TKNAFSKFEKALGKALGKQLEGFNEEEYVELKKIQERFDWAEEILSDATDDDDDASVSGRVTKSPPPHRARRVARAKDPKLQAARVTRRRKEEEAIDKHIDDMLGSEDDETGEANEVESALSVAGASDSDDE